MSETMIIKTISNKYDDVALKLFANDGAFYIDAQSRIIESEVGTSYSEPNNCTSRKQAEKLLAINMLLNTARFLNGEWKPNWDDTTEKWTFIIDENDDIISVYSTYAYASFVYFKSEELLQQAIDILGEETIRLALSTDW